jgi:hypothetical protein
MPRKPPPPGPGRPKGSQNKVTLAMKDISRGILEQPEALNVLKRQARAGRLNPAIHIALMHYAYGKPKETIAHEGLTAAKEMTDDALRAALADLSAKLSR